jgi:hypothetical protein
MQLQDIAKLINTLQEIADTTNDENTLNKINTVIDTLFNNYIPN